MSKCGENYKSVEQIVDVEIIVQIVNVRTKLSKCGGKYKSMENIVNVEIIVKSWR